MTLMTASLPGHSLPCERCIIFFTLDIVFFELLFLACLGSFGVQFNPFVFIDLDLLLYPLYHEVL